MDWRHLSTVTAVLAGGGLRRESRAASIRLGCRGPLRGVPPVRTAPYPGFPTDAQAPLMAVMARSSGCTVFVENIFESRYRHVDELTRMGADIRVEGRVAVVYGVPRLHGAKVQAADLRGGAPWWWPPWGRGAHGGVRRPPYRPGITSPWRGICPPWGPPSGEFKVFLRMRSQIRNLWMGY